MGNASSATSVRMFGMEIPKTNCWLLTSQRASMDLSQKPAGGTHVNIDKNICQYQRRSTLVHLVRRFPLTSSCESSRFLPKVIICSRTPGLTVAIPQLVTMPASIQTGTLILVLPNMRIYKARIEYLAKTITNVYVISAMKNPRKK